MIAVHARYRGREKARAAVVERSAEALSGLPGVAGFEVLGVEDIRSKVEDAEAALNLIMALLSDGNWAIGLGIAERLAGRGLTPPVYLSANIPGGDEHNQALTEQYAGRLRIDA